MFQNLLAFEVVLYFMMLTFGACIAAWIASAFIYEISMVKELRSKHNEPHATGDLIPLAMVYTIAGIIWVGCLLATGASESMGGRLSGTAKLVIVINWFVFTAIGALVKYIQLKRKIIVVEETIKLPYEVSKENIVVHRCTNCTSLSPNSRRTDSE